jgi:hypothetical protein
MVKLNFQDPLLEKIFRNWKWTRNNTILLFESAFAQGGLEYRPPYKEQEEDPRRYTLFYQFQCIITATDAYYRLLTTGEARFGMFVEESGETDKMDISVERIAALLDKQIRDFDVLFKDYSAKDLEEHIKHIQSLLNHENMHHGQLIVMFREAGLKFPQRFAQAWAL